MDEKTPTEQIKIKLNEIIELTKENKPKIRIFKKINEIKEMTEEIEKVFIDFADFIIEFNKGLKN